jgi:hypothetical protein
VEHSTVFGIFLVEVSIWAKQSTSTISMKSILNSVLFWKEVAYGDKKDEHTDGKSMIL